MYRWLVIGSLLCLFFGVSAYGMDPYNLSIISQTEHLKEENGAPNGVNINIEPDSSSQNILKALRIAGEASDSDNKLDTMRLHMKGDFDQQVDELLMRVTLSQSEVAELKDLFHDIENTLKMCLKGCKVYPFGSMVTGLAIKTSDVDFKVEVPTFPQHQSLDPVYEVTNCLQSLPMLFGDVQPMPAAEVPLVKCYHLPRHRYCDISFSGYAGVRTSKLTHFLLHMDYRALPLAIIIKYWAKVHNLTGLHLMRNHAIAMMVIFYLQQVNILPPVCELQKNVEKYIVEDWNTAFQEDFQFESTNNESLYVLLGGFFEFYRNFKFDEFIVSPFLGKPVSRSQFLETESLPEEYELYKSLVRENVTEPMKLTAKICVQDPFEHDLGSGTDVSDKFAENVIHFISESAGKFKVVTKENFLEAILKPRQHG